MTKAVRLRAKGEGGVQVAKSLVEQQVDSRAAADGIAALVRLGEDGSLPAFRWVLALPWSTRDHPARAIQRIGKRRVTPLAPDVRRLCGHHRKAVRDAAASTLAALKAGRCPPFSPSEALNPWIEQRVRDLGSAVYPPIPATAEWRRVSGDNLEQGMSGWYLGEVGGVARMVDLFGRERVGPAGRWVTEPRTLADEVPVFRAYRADPRRFQALLPVMDLLDDRKRAPEVSQVSIPEALAAAWALERGDRETAAGILLPALEAAPDDLVLQSLGVTFVDESLRFLWERLVGNRDFDDAAARARRLATATASEGESRRMLEDLARDLESRREDFRTFALPSPEDWTRRKASLTRAEQVEFLVARLRLLNSVQGNEAGMPLDAPQFAEPATGPDGRLTPSRTPVINPFHELLEMHLEPAEACALIPRIVNRQPSLTWETNLRLPWLHQWFTVGDVTALVVNKAAYQALFRIDPGESMVGPWAFVFNRARADGRRQDEDRARVWCQLNGRSTRLDLALSILGTACSQAAKDIVRDFPGNPAVADALLRCAAADVDRQPTYARLLLALDSPRAVPQAREWLRDTARPELRETAARILMRHGDLRDQEGLRELIERSRP